MMQHPISFKLHCSRNHQRHRMAEDEDQYIVPLDNALALDGPELETHMETLDVNTEVLDIPDSIEYAISQSVDETIDDSVKDIVLDSDDEGTKVVGNAPSLKEMKISEKGCASSMEKMKLNALGYMGRQHKNVSGDSIQRLASARRRITDAHDDIEQHGPASCADTSYHKNNFYSASGNSKLEEELSDFPDCSERMMESALDLDVIDEEKLASSNCQIMDGAKDVPPVTCHHHELVIVDNTDSREPGKPSNVNALNFVDHFPSINNLNLSEKFESGTADRIKSLPSFCAKGAQTLARRANLAAKARELGIFDWDEKQTTEPARVLDEEFDVGSLWQPSEKDESETNAQDIFDVGFNTQLAAEAMEALIYAPAPPPNSREKCSHRSLYNDIRNSSEDASKEKESKVCGFIKKAGSQINKKQPEDMKSSASKLNGRIACPFKKHSENLKGYSSPSSIKKTVICREPLASKSLNRRHPLTMKKNICGRKSRVISQQMEDGTSEIDNLRGASANLSASEFVKNNQHGEEMFAKKLRKYSHTKKRTQCQPSEISLEKSKDPVSSFKRRMSTNLEFDVPKKRRKRSSVGVEVCKRKSFNSGSVTNSKRTHPGRSTSGLFGTSSLSKFDPWCYPKQKRTHKGVPHHSNGFSNLSALLSLADEKSKNKYPTENRKSGPLLYCQTEFQSFPERRPLVNLSKRKTKQKCSPGVDKCESAITSEQMVPMDLKQSGKSDIIGPTSSANYSENSKLGAVSADTKASRTSKSDEEYKIPDKKILSRPSLMKELTLLGYEKYLPNFMPRETRRRSTKASVLFSQHLKSNILNRQKKIMIRLGFSVASCCSDATHFVTDGFARTRNMLETIAFGKPVVTHLWLESCGLANTLINEERYILRDAKKEKEIGFSMPVSLTCARQNPLLKGRRVFITANVKPGIELIQSLVKAVQGEAVKLNRRAEQKDEIIPNDVLILSAQEDYATCVPHLEKGAAVYDSELLLNGIVIQKLEFERHQLFTNYVERNCSSNVP